MDLVLLPGQTLPMKFNNPQTIEFFTNRASGNSSTEHQETYFGLFTADQVDAILPEDFSRVNCSKIGTLFQVLQ